MELISLQESKIAKFNFSNPFHAKKVLLHSDKLRKAVLESAYISRPSNLEDWQSIHIASLLSQEFNWQHASLSVLSTKLSGSMLLNTSNEREIEMLLSGRFLISYPL
jgi:hypothetical protein